MPTTDTLPVKIADWVAGAVAVARKCHAGRAVRRGAQGGAVVGKAPGQHARAAAAIGRRGWNPWTPLPVSRVLLSFLLKRNSCSLGELYFHICVAITMCTFKKSMNLPHPFLVSLFTTSLACPPLYNYVKNRIILRHIGILGNLWLMLCGITARIITTLGQLRCTRPRMFGGLRLCGWQNSHYCGSLIR